MSEAQFDVVIRNGTIGAVEGRYKADIGIQGDMITAIGSHLGAGKVEIDAREKYVVPGGVDAHAHVEQVSAGGLLNADTFESATLSAACGGTTTLISFAAQHRNLDLKKVVMDYTQLAENNAFIDYAFHMIIANPDKKTIEQDIPDLIHEGHSSLKVFMTYDLIKVDDEPLLDILMAARNHGAMICVHAENHGMISWMSKRLIEKGYIEPKYHAVSHPRASEAEAIRRLISMCEFIDQPVMIFHVSTSEGIAAVSEARSRGLKVFAETCPQYLFLTRHDLDKAGLEGAKWMCSPPPREYADQDALWLALSLGVLQTVSSDHAPYRFDETGKLSAGKHPNFKQIANGLPGLETRLPLLFDALVTKGRPEFGERGLEAFVGLTATNPASIYNLSKKGRIAPGCDADIVIWDPQREVTITDDAMHDRTGFTPFAGHVVRGWPDTVLLRGQAIIKHGEIQAKDKRGALIRRSGGWAAKPLGRTSHEFNPATNFGAKLA